MMSLAGDLQAADMVASDLNKLLAWVVPSLHHHLVWNLLQVCKWVIPEKKTVIVYYQITSQAHMSQQKHFLADRFRHRTRKVKKILSHQYKRWA